MNDPLAKVTEKEDRLVQLAAISDTIEKRTLQKRFEEEDMAQMRVVYADSHIEVIKLKEELAELAEPIQEQIKEKTKLAKRVLKDLRQGYFEAEGTVYLVRDDENGNMYEYDEDGEFMQMRRMTASERQTNIKFLNPK